MTMIILKKESRRMLRKFNLKLLNFNDFYFSHLDSVTEANDSDINNAQISLHSQFLTLDIVKRDAMRGVICYIEFIARDDLHICTCCATPQKSSCCTDADHYLLGIKIITMLYP